MSGQTATWSCSRAHSSPLKNQRKSQSFPTGPCLRMVGFIELVWFQGVKILESVLKGKEYIVYRRVNIYGGKRSVPIEMEEYVADIEFHKTLDPVYSSTEKLDSLGLDGRAGESCSKPYSRSLVQMTYRKPTWSFAEPIAISDRLLHFDGSIFQKTKISRMQ